jgi:hypothetical protein
MTSQDLALHGATFAPTSQVRMVAMLVLMMTNSKNVLTWKGV